MLLRLRPGPTGLHRHRRYLARRSHHALSFRFTIGPPGGKRAPGDTSASGSE
jgi:hypothetical protein